MRKTSLTTQVGALATVQPSEADKFLAMIQWAVQNQVDAGNMRQLLDMHTEVVKRAAEVAFKQSMVRLQSRIPALFKTSEIVVSGATRSRYAALESIDKVVRPLMSEEGFSVSYDSEQATGGTVWKCIISHSDGHQRTYCLPPMPNDNSGSKNAVQAIGSTIQYARRYALCNALNLVTRGIDDDGHGATPCITTEQVQIVLNYFASAEMDAKRQSGFLAYAEAKTVEDIKAHRWEDCVKMLRAAERAVLGGRK